MQLYKFVKSHSSLELRFRLLTVNGRHTLTESIDCSIVEHEQFQRMSVVVARTLQVESNTLNMLGTQENMDRVEYLNITYGQSSAKLPVTQLLGHSVTRSVIL